MGRHPGGARRGHGRDPARTVHDRAAAVPQLDSREGAVFVYGIGHERMGANIVFVPQGREGQGRVVGAGIDRDVACTDDTPAALGLRPAERRAHVRHRVGHAAGVRHRVEPVGRRYGADLHRLEEHVVAGIARHTSKTISVPRLLQIWLQTLSRL